MDGGRGAGTGWAGSGAGLSGCGGDRERRRRKWRALAGRERPRVSRGRESGDGCANGAVVRVILGMHAARGNDWAGPYLHRAGRNFLHQPFRFQIPKVSFFCNLGCI